MVSIPGGELRSCRNPQESPKQCREPELVAPFFIDRLETTVAEYTDCVSAGACSAEGHDAWVCNWPHRRDRRAHPINCLSYHQAEAYCRWQGKRLPTGAEWEFAARSGDGRKYPWGNEEKEHDEALAQGACWEKPGTCPVGEGGIPHPYGLHDTAGNVSEWTSTDVTKDSWLSRYISKHTRSVKWRVAFGTDHTDPVVHRGAHFFVAKASLLDADQPLASSVGVRCAK